MKTSSFLLLNRRFPARLGVSFLVIGFSSLFFVRCATEDLEYLEPFELVFSDEFENLVTPPNITEKEPVVQTPPKSEVKIPQEVTPIFTSLKQDTKPEDIAKAMAPATQGLTSFLASANEEKKEKLESLTKEVNVSFLTQLKSGSVKLDELTLGLIKDAEGSKDLQKLLPVVTLPTLSGRLVPVLDPDQGEKAEDKSFRIQNLVGPCRDAANEAYEAELAKLNVLRATEEAKIQAAFQRRIGEALVRYNSRVTQAQTAFNTAWDQNVTAVFNLLVSQLPSLSSSQVQYLILYIVTTANSLLKALEADLGAIVKFYADEQKEITGLRTTTLAAITTWYTAEKKDLDAQLQKVLSSCHNQGTGN